jgi:hypothetical protein
VKSKLAKPQPPLGDQEFADQTIAACDDRSGALLTILEKVQEHNPHKYLPLEILEYIAEKTGIPLAQIFSVAPFMPCSTWSRRAITPSASAAARPATRAARAACCSAPPGAGRPDESDDGADKVCVTTPTINSRCAPSPASANARWRRWWKWITPFSAI